MRPAILVACLLGVACASTAPQREAAQLAEYQRVAGDPVEEFFFWDLRNGWQVLGTDHLVVWTTPWDAYLLRVRTPCTDLPFAQTIAVSSTGNRVHRGLDSVRTLNSIPCPIEEIRPVDYRRYLAAHAAASKSAGKLPYSDSR
jgi:Family of unknown function (DUF6491)